MSYQAEDCKSWYIANTVPLQYGSVFQIHSQVPGIRGSTWMIPHGCGTRGTKMQSEQKDLKTGLSATPLSVTTLYDARSEKWKPYCLGQESSEAAQFQNKKPRSRWSGAARRRFKKQREKEKQEAERAAFLTFSAFPANMTGGVNAATSSIATADPSESLKRVRTDLRTSDFSDVPRVKRLKVDDQKSCNQTTSGLIMIAIVPIDYPDRRFDTDEIDLIIKLIKSHILSQPRDMKIPTFKDTLKKEGAVIFSCIDNQTGEWLKNFASNMIIKENVQMHALPADELNKRHHIVVHVDDPEMSIKEALEFFDRQNEGLTASKWIVARDKVKISESKDAANFYFSALVDDHTLKVLQDLNFKPFCGLSQATVKLLKK